MCWNAADFLAAIRNRLSQGEDLEITADFLRTLDESIIDQLAICEHIHAEGRANVQSLREMSPPNGRRLN